MGDDAHAVGKEISAGAVGLTGQFGLARRNQIAPRCPGADIGKGGLLHRLHLGRQVDQFGVRLTQTPIRQMSPI